MGFDGGAFHYGPEDRDFLIVPYHQDTGNFNVEVSVYLHRWEDRFDLFQSIPSNGACSASVFEADGIHYLIFANFKATTAEVWFYNPASTNGLIVTGGFDQKQVIVGLPGPDKIHDVDTIKYTDVNGVEHIYLVLNEISTQTHLYKWNYASKEFDPLYVDSNVASAYTRWYETLDGHLWLFDDSGGAFLFDNTTETLSQTQTLVVGPGPPTLFRGVNLDFVWYDGTHAKYDPNSMVWTEQSEVSEAIQRHGDVCCLIICVVRMCAYMRSVRVLLIFVVYVFAYICGVRVCVLCVCFI